MTVFALSNGKLVGAPTYSQRTPEVTDQVLNGIRDEAVNLIERPLFVVGWTTADARSGNQESLIALDTAGQVVTVEVLAHLDAAGLISALARAGRHGDLKRGNLIDLFPGSSAEFASDWTSFLEHSSTSVGRGPKLYLFVADLADDVREPLSALSGLGVQAKQIILHEGAHGVLVEVVDFEHNRPFLLSSVDEVPAITTTQSENSTPVVTRQKHEEAQQTGEPAQQTYARAPQEVEPAQQGYAPGDESTEEIVDDSPVDEWGIEKSDWEIDGWNTLPMETPAKQRNSAIVLAERSAQAKRAAQLSRRSRRSAAMSVAKPVEAKPETVDAKPVEAKPETVEAKPETVDAQQEIATTKPETAEATMDLSQPTEPMTSEKRLVVPELPTVSRRLNNRDELLEKLAATQSIRTMYDELIAANKPAEQRLWEMSAPTAASHAMFFSESTSAADSARAVAEASESGKPWARISQAEIEAVALNKMIVKNYGGEVQVFWHSPRRGIDISATLTADGYFTLADGRKFSDPAQAARALANIGHLDAWRGWRAKSGVSLGELR